ncbi:hypothetical protein L3X38_032277 [Prunus dulcis]|uniref:Uncharacterized protein n=1 Tax=Prunus dulcis TaxID=3755 RepID=A0AAD4VDT0_PRUDU|nr:hypothetical protein L3X38_032277 [Prunus dulcis]
MAEAVNPPGGAMSESFGHPSSLVAETRHHPLGPTAESEVLSEGNAIAHVEASNTVSTSAFLGNHIDLNRNVDELTERFEDPNNLVDQLLGQIDLIRDLEFGPVGEESTRAPTRDSRNPMEIAQELAGKVEDKNVLIRDKSRASVHSRLGLQTNVHSRLGAQSIWKSSLKTLADVFTMAECYAFLDDDRIAIKKSGKQVHQSQKEASEKNDGSYNRNNGGKRKSRLTEGGSSTDKT